MFGAILALFTSNALGQETLNGFFAVDRQACLLATGTMYRCDDNRCASREYRQGQSLTPTVPIQISRATTDFVDGNSFTIRSGDYSMEYSPDGGVARRIVRQAGTQLITTNLARLNGTKLYAFIRNGERLDPASPPVELELCPAYDDIVAEQVPGSQLPDTLRPRSAAASTDAVAKPAEPLAVPVAPEAPPAEGSNAVTLRNLLVDSTVAQRACNIMWDQTTASNLAEDSGLMPGGIARVVIVMGLQGPNILRQVPDFDPKLATDVLIAYRMSPVRGRTDCRPLASELTQRWNAFAAQFPELPKYHDAFWAYATDFEYDPQEIRSLGQAKYVMDQCRTSKTQRRLYSSRYERMRVIYENIVKQDKFYEPDFESGLLEARERYGKMDDAACADSVDDLNILGVQLLR